MDTDTNMDISSETTNEDNLILYTKIQTKGSIGFSNANQVYQYYNYFPCKIIRQDPRYQKFIVELFNIPLDDENNLDKQYWNTEDPYKLMILSSYYNYAKQNYILSLQFANMLLSNEDEYIVPSGTYNTIFLASKHIDDKEIAMQYLYKGIENNEEDSYITIASIYMEKYVDDKNDYDSIKKMHECFEWLKKNNSGLGMFNYSAYFAIIGDTENMYKYAQLGIEFGCDLCYYYIHQYYKNSNNDIMAFYTYLYCQFYAIGPIKQSIIKNKNKMESSGSMESDKYEHIVNLLNNCILLNTGFYTKNEIDEYVNIKTNEYIENGNNPMELVNNDHSFLL